MAKREYIFYYLRRDKPCEKILYKTEATSEPKESPYYKELEEIYKNDPDISGIGFTNFRFGKWL
jgi:hypothetical protein